MKTAMKTKVKKPEKSRAGRPPKGAPAKSDHVLTVAAAMFLKRGYGGVSIDAVAAAGGVSKATIYTHFGDKAGLFAAVVSDLVGRHANEVALAQAFALPPAEGLAAFARASLALMASETGLDLFRMVIGASHDFPRTGEIFYERAMGVMIGRLETYLTRMDAEGALAVPDPAMAAFQFLGLYKEALFWPRLVIGARSPLKLEREAVIARAVAIFMATHAARPLAKRRRDK